MPKRATGDATALRDIRCRLRLHVRAFPLLMAHAAAAAAHGDAPVRRAVAVPMASLHADLVGAPHQRTRSAISHAVSLHADLVGVRATPTHAVSNIACSAGGRARAHHANLRRAAA